MEEERGFFATMRNERQVILSKEKRSTKVSGKFSETKDIVFLSRASKKNLKDTRDERIV
jgi:uncharacterized protein YifE (UPF0438 family)